VEAAAIAAARRADVVPFVAVDREHGRIDAELNEAFSRRLSSRAFVLRAEVDRFESEFADYCEVAHCVGVGSGTAASQPGPTAHACTRCSRRASRTATAWRRPSGRTTWGRQSTISRPCTGTPRSRIAWDVTASFRWRRRGPRKNSRYRCIRSRGTRDRARRRRGLCRAACDGGLSDQEAPRRRGRASRVRRDRRERPPVFWGAGAPSGPGTCSRAARSASSFATAPACPRLAARR
jgi:DegT/DnrJ/EryC1/StrS aminotransferase family